jgi:hypothetical protein
MKLIIGFLVLYVSLTLGQTFTAEAPIPTVKRKAFYRILLDPASLVYASPDFANLRITDNQNREVPYLLAEETPTFSTPQFKDYKIKSKTIEPNCCTSLILENATRKPINNISLIIKNAENNKEATLLGSDDKKTWYALKERFYLDAINGASQTFEIRILNFPLSNYTFLKLNINDSTSAPLNILRAGYYETQTMIGNYARIPSMTFTVADSVKQKQTWLSMRFDTAQLVDKLDLTITGQPYYLRQATLYHRENRKNKKGKSEAYNRFMQNIELTSTHSATILLYGEKVDHLILVIENNDNPPLQFASVEAWQLNRYLTAFLENDKAYWLKFGEVKMRQPVYDLSFFKDSIHSEPTVLKVGMIRRIGPAIKKPKPANFFTSQAFIWSAIIGVAMVLTFMTVRMIREKTE